MLVFGLFLAAIASWVSVRRIRARLEDLSHTIEDQQTAIEGLIAQVEQLRRQTREAQVAPAAPSPVVTQTPPPVPVARPAAAPPAMPPQFQQSRLSFTHRPPRRRCGRRHCRSCHRRRPLHERIRGRIFRQNGLHWFHRRRRLHHRAHRLNHRSRRRRQPRAPRCRLRSRRARRRRSQPPRRPRPSISRA